MVLIVPKQGHSCSLAAGLLGIKSGTFERVVTSYKIVFQTTSMKIVCSLWRKNVPCHCTGRSQHCFKDLIVQGTIRLLHFIKTADQPKTFQKAKRTFSGNINCTDKRSKCLFCRSSWQLDATLTIVGLLSIRKSLRKTRNFTKKHQIRFVGVSGMVAQCSTMNERKWTKNDYNSANLETQILVILILS